MPQDIHSLGGPLRAWRERLHPSDVGLEWLGPRRTKGLRREELAQLAGVSVDYVVRLEQGRSLTPSAQIVASLARALQLDRTETEPLYRGAGLLPPESGTVSHHIPPAGRGPSAFGRAPRERSGVPVPHYDGPRAEHAFRRALGRRPGGRAPDPRQDDPHPGRRFLTSRSTATS